MALIQGEGTDGKTTAIGVTAAKELNVNIGTLSGENTTLNRLFGGTLWLTKDNQTASAVIKATPGAAGGIYVHTAASGQTVALHDCATVGAAAAGNLKKTLSLASVGYVAAGPVTFATGVVAVISGGSPVFGVEYL